MGLNTHSWDYPECPECESDVFVSHTTKDLYMCEMCAVSFEHDGETTSDPFPPQNKGERVNWHKSNTPIEEATEEEIQSIYKLYSEFYISQSNNNNEKKQHLPTRKPGKTLCDSVDGFRSENIRKVEDSIYPPGYNDFCKNCLKVWREEIK